MLQEQLAAPDFRITLRSGRHFDLSNPKSNEIVIEDIAHGLAHTCRYAGQCDGFYSVAEHSVLVSLVAPQFKLAALLHDAAEALIGDMPAPLKRLLPGYKAIENQIEQMIFNRFGIAWPAPAEVKHSDYRVMAAELPVLMPFGTNEWLHEAKITPASVEIRRLPPEAAKELFLDRYSDLVRQEKPNPIRMSA